MKLTTWTTRTTPIRNTSTRLQRCAVALACAALMPAVALAQTGSGGGSGSGNSGGGNSGGSGTSQNPQGTTGAPGSATGSMGSGTGSGMGSGMGASGRNNLPRGDRNFVEKAAAGGLAEVEAGRMGQQRATNDQVKQFGAKMVEDHTRVNDELKTIATAKGLTPPMQPEASSRRHMESLAKKSGADFDRDYMKHMVDDHKKNVALFKKQSEDGQDPELKAFAAKTLPALQQHLQMAQQLQDSVKK